VAENVLLIDQGNTRLKWLWARDGEIITKLYGHGDLYSLNEEIRSNAPGRPAKMMVSSVAGADRAQQLADFCRTHWRVTARFLESKAEQGGVSNGYAEPGTLGVDRWLAIVGAVARHGKPVVVWDLGTATTLDAVDETGRHLGGQIFPGPQTMLDSLRRDTRLRVPKGIENSRTGDSDDGPLADSGGVPPGRSTADCISRGVLAAQLGALNQFMRNAAAQMKKQPGLVVTGGAASPILSLLDFDCIHDPWLVFRGMLVD